MKSDGPSPRSERKAQPRIVRRLEIRLTSEQDPGKLRNQLAELVRPFDVEVRPRGGGEHARRLNVDIIGSMLDVAEAVEAVKGGLGAQIMRDQAVPAPGAPRDSLYPDPESARRIAVPVSADGPVSPSVPEPVDPVVVAIIDSGIMARHPDVGARLWSKHPGFNALDPKSNYEDRDGHGTMLAGTVLAGAGQDPCVRLMAVKFFDGRTIPESGRAALAIKEAVRRGAHILNLSWAVGIDKQQAIHDAIAGAPRALVVVAAGNSGADNDGKYRTIPASYGAKLPNVLTVMATDDLDDKPGFSNYGAKSVHIAAPGVRVISTHSYLSPTKAPGDLVRYQRYDGTSAAAAYVAGAAALLLCKNRSLSPEEIKEVLRKTAERRSDLRGRCLAQGRLNVSRALAEV